MLMAKHSKMPFLFLNCFRFSELCLAKSLFMNSPGCEHTIFYCLFSLTLSSIFPSSNLVSLICKPLLPFLIFLCIVHSPKKKENINDDNIMALKHKIRNKIIQALLQSLDTMGCMKLSSIFSI